MKKNLLFTGAMALFTVSCTQSEFEQLDAPSKAEGQGVAFVASIDEDADTRAAYNPNGSVFDHNWYADKDKIGVFYKKDTKVSPNSGEDVVEIAGNGWMGLKKSTSESHSFEFKATTSGTSGYFVANGDANTLWLDAPANATTGYTDTEKPVFRAFWPYVDADHAAADGNKISLANYASANQNQTNIKGGGIADKAFMVSESDADYAYVADDNSVARERFSLKFKRINPIVYFKVKTNASADDETLNREYKRDYAEGLFSRFGKLKSIELEAEGSTKTGSGQAASVLTFGSDDKWNIGAKNVYDPTPVSAEAPDGAFVKGSSAGASKITLTLNSTSGLDWSNSAVAYMAIANVSRAEYREKGEEERVVATYTFEKIQLQSEVTTDKDWAYTGDKPKWIGFPRGEGYNLDSERYIAYEYANGKYALEVNPSFEGSLSDLFEGSNLKTIKKADGSAIAKTDIEHFVSKVAITAAADFATIKTLTALTNVTLLENTTIPAEAFKGLAGLVYLNLPKVTKVDNVNAFPENGYTDVYMGAYDFSDKTGTNQTAVRDRLLKKASLVKADISAVERINAGFPTSGITFDSFSKLEEITVKNGVEVGATAFKDCENLTTVQFPKDVTNGTVNLVEGANSQFIGCKAIETIAISNTVIPDLAFSGCEKLTAINNAEGNAIVPTSIGISSFEGCKAIEDMDLSDATTIGKAAFKDCEKLKGNNNKNGSRTVLYVDKVQHVSDNAFNGCKALQYISFAEATTIGVGILSGTTCTEIEFLKPFTVNSETATTVSTDFFGTTTGTKLFCAKAQTGVNVNDITLTGNATGSVAAKTSFSNITRYDK